MNIPRAVELLKMLQINLASDMDADDINSIQLGIEALKRVEDCRQVVCEFAPVLLPGETKD